MGEIIGALVFAAGYWVGRGISLPKVRAPAFLKKMWNNEENRELFLLKRPMAEFLGQDKVMEVFMKDPGATIDDVINL